MIAVREGGGGVVAKGRGKLAKIKLEWEEGAQHKAQSRSRFIHRRYVPVFGPMPLMVDE